MNPNEFDFSREPDDFHCLSANEQEESLRRRNERAYELFRAGQEQAALAEWSAAAQLGESMFTHLPAAGRGQVLRAFFNEGLTHGQQGRPGAAIDGYRRATALGAPVFPELDADGRAQVLRAFVNEGFTHEQQGRPEAAIDGYRRATALGAPVFPELDAAGRAQVLRAFVNEGVTHGQQGRPEAAIDGYRRATALGAPVFPELDAAGGAEVLRAFVNEGVAHEQQGRPEAAIDGYRRATALGAPVFPELDAAGRAQVLRAFVNEGVTHGQQGRPEAAIDGYRRATALGAPVFPELDAAGGAEVLRAFVNEGVAHEQQGRPEAAIDGYRRATALGAPVFPELDADGGAEVLRAFFNEGVTHGQQGRPEAAIDGYRRATALGAPVFPELDAAGRAPVLCAFVNEGVAHGQQGRPEAAIDGYRRATALGAPVFPELDAAGRAQVLRAFVNEGVTHGQQGRPEAAIDGYRRATALGAPVFPELDAAGGAEVLRAFVNEGVAHEQQGRPEAAIDGYRRATALGAPVFPELDAAGRAPVLCAFVNEGVAHGQQGRPEAAIDGYRRATALGAPVFPELDAAGRAQVLRAFVNEGVTHGQQGRPEAAIDGYRRATALGAPVFPELDAAGGAEVLRAFFNEGVTHGQQGRPEAAIDGYRRATALGAPVFPELDAAGRAPVLCAFVNEGVAHGQQGRPEAAIDGYRRATALGAPVFPELDAAGRAQVLRAFVNEGVTHGQQGRPEAAIDGYRRATALGAPVFPELDADGRAPVLDAFVNEGVTYYLESEPGQETALWTVFLAGRSGLDNRDGFTQTALKAFRDALSETPSPLLGWRACVAFAHDWLSTAAGWAASASNSRQRRRLVTLGGFLVGEAGREHRQQLAALAPELGGRQAACPKLAGWASAQVLSTLRLADADCGWLLLARVRASLGAAERVSDWPLQAPWQLDPAGLAEAIRLDRLWFADGGARAPYAWIDDAGEPRLEARAFGTPANDFDPPTRQALLDWRQGDPQAAIALLDGAWRRLSATGTIGRLTRWLELLGAGETAQEQAIDAVIYRDVEQVLRQAFREWVDTRLRDGERDADLNGVMASLLEWFSAPAADWNSPGFASAREQAVLDRLHPYLAAEVEALAPGTASVPSASGREALWRALELQRYVLTSAATLVGAPRVAADAQALTALNTALQGELSLLFERLRRAEQGLPDLPLDRARREDLFSVLESMAGEIDRLGMGLAIPGPAECARALAAEESLVQVWMSANGRMQVLALTAAGSGSGNDGPAEPPLRHQVLAEDFSKDAWEPLLTRWESILQGGPELTWRSPAHLALTHVPAALSSRDWWADFVAESSPATRFLAWLSEQGLLTGERRCVVVLPARLSRLPWLARAVTGMRGQPESAAGKLRLEISVASWLQCRSAPSESGERGQAVFLAASSDHADGRFGRTEAAVAARAMQVEAHPAHGIVELVRALCAAGPAHLVVHGAFDPGEPTRSYLSADRTTPHLPAWILAALPVCGDISLSACEAMLVGDGEHRWQGPVGIGPLLRARGARSVVGALGFADQLASLLFFQLWFAERRTKSAVEALASTQQTLRSLSLRRAQRLLKEIGGPDAQMFDTAVRQHNADAKRQGWQTPFADPRLWASFTLIGDAPPEPYAARPAKDRFADWLGSLWERVCRFLRLPAAS
ncbi:MAG: CHAT domain-containing protein [Candidatus Accumulibacter cognatus]|uniref:CHAT domain-containing protein n=1 Tax=Candidatus Accumulibacter cognatus TaxID=2954383 RepID=A0A7D5NB65_9PROT|nr:MAG: CHAT domain-containing protein [Candidatus Accumulibacter cognatus]